MALLFHQSLSFNSRLNQGAIPYQKCYFRHVLADEYTALESIR
ncbi:MAG: hypothetical protein VYB60_03935 [SAR324 cluster bacterium]|nr:hypothetical protein [SAR324 cluster bacterium]